MQIKPPGWRTEGSQFILKLKGYDRPLQFRQQDNTPKQFNVILIVSGLATFHSHPVHQPIWETRVKIHCLMVLMQSLIAQSLLFLLQPPNFANATAIQKESSNMNAEVPSINPQNLSLSNSYCGVKFKEFVIIPYNSGPYVKDELYYDHIAIVTVPGKKLAGIALGPEFIYLSNRGEAPRFFEEKVLIPKLLPGQYYFQVGGKKLQVIGTSSANDMFLHIRNNEILVKCQIFSKEEPVDFTFDHLEAGDRIILYFLGLECRLEKGETM